MPSSRTGTLATRSESVPAARAAWHDYLERTKPKVVALIVFTAIVGTLLASPGLPPLDALIWGNLGIACASACAAVINHVLDRRIDEQMGRTRGRPLPTGRLTESRALIFAAILGVTAMSILGFKVNLSTAVLTFASLIGYAVVYTVWLKRATSQNIVIGGAAGGGPPGVAEARRLAEHRHRRSCGSGSAGARLDRRDRSCRSERAPPVSDHF